jgi:hypothetical protein
LPVLSGDSETLAPAMRGLLRDVAQCRTIGARGRQAFEVRFSADRLSIALAQTHAGLGIVP